MVLTPRGVLCSQANVLTCQLSQDQVQTDYVNVHMSGKHHFSKVAMHAVAVQVLIDHFISVQYCSDLPMQHVCDPTYNVLLVCQGSACVDNTAAFS